MSLRDLNENQKQAVLTDKKRVLVLAGAGSGKTKTLIQKLLYLLEQGIKPSNILAITFTKNAANEMVDRLIAADDPTGEYEKFISDKYITKAQKESERFKQVSKRSWLSSLTVKTFHSLCYQILRNSGSAIFDNKFRIVTDDRTVEISEESGASSINAPEKFSDIIQKILLELCKNPEYLLKLKRYILDFYIDRSFDEKKTNSRNAYKQFTYTTLKGEQVKSKSERDIADWLYRHNIKYEYEPAVKFKDFEFKPDFYLPQAGMFVEHLSGKSYKTKDKEDQFEHAGRKCVKTYEGMMQSTALFNHSLERIIMGQIHDKIDPHEALNYEEELKGYQHKVNEFLRMVSRLLSTTKSDDIDLDTIAEKAKLNQHERVRVFYELAIPILKAYKDYCTNKSYVDFDDLVILSCKLLANNPDIKEVYQSRYKFVLVDEFQDVNNLQVKLLRQLIRPDTQLFCVGDDWQSIYGFRGSEVDYIVNFEKYFKDPEIIKLDINYRSRQNIVGASNEVIKYNKFKIEKNITAFNQTPTSIQIYKAKEIEKDGVDYLVERVNHFIDEGYTAEDILILYRRSAMFQPFKEALKEAGLAVSSKTIHAAKGLEAKVVFIIGLTEGSGGFPDIWMDDIVFRVVKEVPHQILMEEERRLFYVAITRAREELFLITQIGKESSFIDEIPKHFYSMNKIEFKSVLNPVLVCGGCRYEIKKGDKYCSQCGNKLDVF